MKSRTVLAFMGGVVTVLALVVVGLVSLLLSRPSAAPVPDDLAARFGVSIVWFDNQSPCGPSDDFGGCFEPVTPDLIYVMKGLDPEVERSIILHEIGHVLQYRLGEPLDECAADLFARSMGATWAGYAEECPPI